MQYLLLSFLSLQIKKKPHYWPKIRDLMICVSLILPSVKEIVKTVSIT